MSLEEQLNKVRVEQSQLCFVFMENPPVQRASTLCSVVLTIMSPLHSYRQWWASSWLVPPPLRTLEQARCMRSSTAETQTMTVRSTHFIPCSTSATVHDSAHLTVLNHSTRVSVRFIPVCLIWQHETFDTLCAKQ